MGCVFNKTTHIKEINVNIIPKEPPNTSTKKSKPIKLVKIKKNTLIDKTLNNSAQINTPLQRRPLDDEKVKNRIKKIYSKENNKMKSLYHTAL